MTNRVQRFLTIAAVLLATLATIAAASSPLDLVDDLIASPSSPEAATLPPPPVKLDKNLRRALLKALVDLEAESAEQHQEENSTNQPEDERSTERDIDESRYDFLEISKQKSTSFSFDGFPSEEDTPSEDKLQNTTFVETDKFVAGDEANRQQPTQDQQPPKDYTKGVQVHHVVPSEKASAIYETKQPGELLETVESRSISSSTSSSSSSVPAPTSPTNNNNAEPPLIQQSVTFAPIVETLQVSASGNIASAAANSLVAPRPTAATRPINETTTQGSKIVQLAGKSNSNANKEEAEDVKIFQAPLVAAFTVQQDERGVPKNIVPLYKSANNAQPLSLQEQLEFKQRLLEKQLAQLQAQQAQQTQFLLRQRQAYEEQVRQKQQQEYFLQEQRRLKLLQEQEQQRLRLQQQQRPAFQQQTNIVQQQLPLPQLQTAFKTNQQQQQANFKPSNVPQPIFKPNNLPQQQQQQQQQPIFKPNNVQQTNFNNAQQQQLTNFNNAQQQQSTNFNNAQQQQLTNFNNVQQQQSKNFNNVQQQQSTLFNNNIQQQKSNFFNNNVQQQQTAFKPNNNNNNNNNVQLQPSLSLEVPSTAPAIPFQAAVQQQLRAPAPVQQQNFQPFPVDFQQPPAPAPASTRFNRQEAFNSVGNFGFNNFQNDDKSIRQSQFVQQQRAQQQNFAFNPAFRQQQQQQQQQRPFNPSVTPARQIQELLYQSGIAGDLQGAGTRNQEDINIVSKVLALNVGAFPEQRANGFQQFTGLKK